MYKIITFVLINILVSIYLIAPFPTAPNLPNGLVSTEPGDTTQISNVKAYYTNQYRKDVMPFFYNNIKTPYILINHPPERAKQVFRDTTQSYYLEEFVIPLKGSIYINGFEWENDVFTKPDQREANKMLVNKVEYKSKVSIRTFESKIYLRFANLILLNITIITILFAIKKAFYEDKR